MPFDIIDFSLHFANLKAIKCIFDTCSYKSGLKYRLLACDEVNSSTVVSYCILQAEVIASTGLSVPDGLAVDWVTKNIYFAESVAKLIYVCNADDSVRTTLISDDIGIPRGLAIDPRDG